MRILRVFIVVLIYTIVIIILVSVDRFVIAIAIVLVVIFDIRRTKMFENTPRKPSAFGVIGGHILEQACHCHFQNLWIGFSYSAYSYAFVTTKILCHGHRKFLTLSSSEYLLYSIIYGQLDSSVPLDAFGSSDSALGRACLSQRF